MISFAAVGLDHPHILHQVGRLLDAGARGVGYWTEGSPLALAGFVERFPGLVRVDDPATFYDDPTVDLIVSAAIPRDRAGIAIRAMEAGKDVMVDKPGCTTLADLDRIRDVVAGTGRIWSVNFSERFEAPAVQHAGELIAQGRIGRVIQTLGLGPHRLHKEWRPDWFFDSDAYGGILTDIASHQIDQFLFFTGVTTAEVVSSTVANHANADALGLQDFGELVLRGEGPSGAAHGYVRVDWFTPDGLDTWGDGRLTVLGTEGYIEIRKNIDIVGRSGADHLFVVDGNTACHVNCAGGELHYYPAFLNDVADRTDSAMAQDHCFNVMELALVAQRDAARVGTLDP